MTARTTPNYSQALGGGICNVAATLNILGCTITNNLALAGNNFFLSDTYPYAGCGFGGGIENNYHGTLNISSSSIAGNIAQGGSETTGPGGDAVGGGISNSPVATMHMTSHGIVASNTPSPGRAGRVSTACW